MLISFVLVIYRWQDKQIDRSMALGALHGYGTHQGLRQQYGFADRQEKRDKKHSGNMKRKLLEN